MLLQIYGKIVYSVMGCNGMKTLKSVDYGVNDFKEIKDVLLLQQVFFFFDTIAIVVIFVLFANKVKII